jgi:hypothetical protein
MDKLIIKPEEDGITHINIYSKGKTKIGRILSNFHTAPFTHIKHGKFSSVEGYWYWLKTNKQHVEFRYTDGYKAKQLGRSFLYEAEEEEYSEQEIIEFRENICIAIEAKILQNQEILKELIVSTLPFQHYMVKDNFRQALPQYDWIVEHIEKCRREFTYTAKKIDF